MSRKNRPEQPKRYFNFNGYDLFAYAFCVIFALMCLYPMWYVFIGSITPSEVSVQQSLRLLPPINPTLKYYQVIITADLFRHSMLISFAKTILGTFGTLLITGMMAYSVSKKNVLGMKVINFMIVFFMFFSGGLIPTYLIYNDLHLLRTFWVMVIPDFMNVSYFIIMRNYFSYNLPEELEQAARIDGANEVRLFFRIVIPLSLPMIAAIGLFLAVAHWNDFTSFLYFVGKAELMPFIVVLQDILRDPNAYMNTQSGFEGVTIQKIMPPASLVNATIIIAMLPILIVYPFLQKYFAKGILIGAVKG